MQRPDLDAPTSEWLVYADSLQVAGDPRGELISLVHGADATARESYVHKHSEALLGAAAKAYRQGAYRFTWHHCFIDTAEVRVTSEDNGEHFVRMLLESPAVTELRELALVGVTDNRKNVDLAPAVAAVASTPWPARCRSLALVDERATRSLMQISTEFGVDENLVAFGELDALWKLPHLERLRLEVADSQYVQFGEIDGASLRSFTLRTLRYGDGWGGEPNQLSAALGATNWPVLEELELRLSETFASNIPFERKPYVEVYSDPENERMADRYDEADDGDNDGINYTELEPFFAKLAKAPLRRLALTSFDSASSLLEVLKRTGLAPTLRVLDFSDSSLRSDHVQWMRDNAKLFAPLTELVLERTGIEDTAGLAGLGPAIKHSHTDGAPTYRYVVGSE